MHKIILDPEDWEKYRGTIVICVRKNGYAFAMFSSGKHAGKMVSRIIMNAPKGFDVDHANRDALDCRKENMRIATKSQNSANRTPKTRNSGLPKGVYTNTQGYQAMIMCKGKRYLLGTYCKVEEAKAAYDRKALELFGEFASL